MGFFLKYLGSSLLFFLVLQQKKQTEKRPKPPQATVTEPVEAAVKRELKNGDG